MAYVYRHIREDKNEPFYIGIGSDSDYKRAATSLDRNKYWVNISKKTKWYFDILVDDISWDLACEKEKEFISLYKRKKDGGFLCNLTLGGEGQLGMTPWNFGKETSEETRKKQSEKKVGKPPPNKGGKMPEHVKEILRKVNKGRQPWNKGMPCNEDVKKKISQANKGLLVKDKHPMWGTKMPDYVKEALRKANENRPPWNKGVKMNDSLLAEHREKRRKQMRAVLKYSLDGVFLKRYDSLGLAAKEEKISKGTLSNACVKRYGMKQLRGFVWEYGDSVENPHIEPTDLQVPPTAQLFLRCSTAVEKH